MLESILRAAGRDAVACGNIGYPVVDAVGGRARRVLAVELSSFQLHWSPSVRPAAGCVLNVAEDHLDWHGSMAAYAAAKARALRGPVAVAGVDDPAAAALLAAAPAARRVGVTLGEPGPDQLGVVDGRARGPRVRRRAMLVDVAAVTPGGPPGLTDALAAAALARAPACAPAAVARRAARRSGPAGTAAPSWPTVGGRRATSTTPRRPTRTPRRRRSPRRRPPRWSGSRAACSRGRRSTTLVAAHGPGLRAAVVIGTDRAEIVAALRDTRRMSPSWRSTRQATMTPWPGCMTAAVRRAAALARPGDIVLLAPAAASMDQFRDYAARGDAFAAAVGRVAGEPVVTRAGARSVGPVGADVPRTRRPSTRATTAAVAPARSTAAPDRRRGGPARRSRQWLRRPLTSLHLVLGVFGLLTLFGLVMVLSASSVEAYRRAARRTRCSPSSCCSACSGSSLFWLGLRIPPRQLRALAPGAARRLRGAAGRRAVPGIGALRNGSRAWFALRVVHRCSRPRRRRWR